MNGIYITNGVFQENSKQVFVKNEIEVDFIFLSM